MQQVIVIALYVLCSVSGVVCIKLGSLNATAIEITPKIFSIKMGWLSLLGLILYIISFLIYIGLVCKNDLSYLIPVTTGAVYLLTLLSSVVVFKESVHLLQIIGSVLILTGVILMNMQAK